MTAGETDPVLTLEPLIEAVREALEDAGWTLSGLQKTTSYEFEGRWAGESSRSAYLFFHADDAPHGVSIDAFLDETSRGLRGNLALVLDGPELRNMDDASSALGSLASAVRDALPRDVRRPISLRLRLSEPDRDPLEAMSEIRFKIHIPGSALEAGLPAIRAMVATSAKAFRSLLGHSRLRPFIEG